MNATMSHTLRRAILLPAFAICLAFAALPDARAHSIEIRTGLVEMHYGYARASFFPAWLRRNRDFHRWYWHSHYRYRQHLDWHRLYHIYLYDRRYHGHRRIVDNHHYYDRRYGRSYRKHN